MRARVVAMTNDQGPDSELHALKEQVRAFKGLVEVSALINGITELDELLPAILDVAKRVMDAEASSMFLVNADGDLELVIGRGDPEATAVREVPHLVVPRGKGIAGWVIEHGRSQLVEDAYADPRFFVDADRQTGFRTRSLMCVPLRQGEEELGVLQVLNPRGRGAFTRTDLEAFEAYGNLVATAIGKLRSLRREREQERVARELDLAMEIQGSFLPSALPEVGGLRCAAVYRPARNIGGDFYDVLVTGPDEVWFAVGDVSGKGIPAALVMAQSVSALRFLIHSGAVVEEVLAKWNDVLCGGAVRGMFVTAALGKIALSRREMVVASAGHVPPVDAGGVLETGRGMAMGIMPGMRYGAATLRVVPGRPVVFVTDGFTESENAAGREFGLEGVIGALRVGSAEEVVCAVCEAEATHRGEAEPRDDRTVLALGFV